MAANARHGKATPRWGTPDDDDTPRGKKGQDIIRRERAVLGRIGFDPCSETRFNAVVKADRFLSWEERQEDGTKLPWDDLVHLNPPGGLIDEFWEKLFVEIRAERVTQCIWVGFSVEQLCTMAEHEYHPTDFQICYLRTRIGFTRHDSFKGAASHGNYLVGIGTDWAKFQEQFGPLGKLQKGPLG